MSLIAENERLQSWKEEESKYELVDKPFYSFVKKPEYCTNEVEKKARFCAKCFYQKSLSIPTVAGFVSSILTCPNCKSDFAIPDNFELNDLTPLNIRQLI